VSSRRLLGVVAASFGLASAPGALAAEPFATVARGDAAGTVIVLDVEQLRRFQGGVIAAVDQAAAPPIDPPRYARCVAALARRGTVRPGSRRAECRRLDRRSRAHAARQLLDLTWVVAEADRRSIRFTARRLARAHREAIELFDGSAGFARFLRDTGLNEADIRLNELSQLAQTAIARQISGSVDPTGLSELELAEHQQIAIDIFREQFFARWSGATTCAPAYASLPSCAPPAADPAPTSGAFPPPSWPVFSPQTDAFRVVVDRGDS
jgi:hypothetical protein